MNKERIEQCTKDIELLKAELSRLEAEQKELELPKYYAGDRFKSTNDFVPREYILVRIDANKWALVDVKRGCLKHTIMDYKEHWNEDSPYITKLPTLFPEATVKI